MALYTAEDVARAWKVAPSTVQRWARESRLPGTITTPGGFYRFTEEALPGPGAALSAGEKKAPSVPADGNTAIAGDPVGNKHSL